MRDLEHILDHTADWSALRGASILLTGGTGFLGSWLLQSILLANERHSLGARVTVLSRTPERYAALYPGATFLAGDVRTVTFPDTPFTHVIHGATDADAALIKADPALVEDTIVEGTKRTLACAERSGARFLFLSSGAVYGASPELHVTEETPPVADSPLYAPYARGKRTAEQLCIDTAHCTPLIARCFTFCGPNIPLDKHYAIGNFIRDALAGGPIVLTGDPRTVRSYLSTADCAVWLWTILLKGQPRRPYNVGSAEAHTLQEVAERVAAVAKLTTGIRLLQEPDPAKPPSVYVPSTDRICSELGVRERIGLTEQIERTLGAL